MKRSTGLVRKATSDYRNRFRWQSLRVIWVLTCLSAPLACLSAPLMAQDSNATGASPQVNTGNSTINSQTNGDETEGDTATQETSPAFPDLTIPPGANIETLQKLSQAAKTAKPTSAEQYKAQQTALKAVSTELLKLLKKDDPAYAQAEIDTIIASVALMAFFTDDEQTDVVEQVKTYLNSRKTLSIQDIQAGMMAAGMLELQPYKEPSREIYQLLDDLLKEDAREEMQSLRLNLQASVRRLGMLGNKFELDAVDIDGNRIRTEDFAGKFLIVDMFATWCQPCLAELPRIQSHFEKYKERGLAVIGISLDEDLSVLQKYLEENPLPWPVIHDGAEDPLQRLSLKYGVNALPTVLLLNKEGTVVSLEARQSELNRLMQMLFETPTPAAEAPSGPKQPEENAVGEENAAGDNAVESSNGDQEKPSNPS